MWKWSPTQREPACESVTQHSSCWTCELSRELPLSAFCLVPPKYSAGGSATLRESILKEILHKGSVALSGIKENQPENRGREILSEANSISGKVPLTPPVTIWLLSSCFSCARLNSRLTSPSLLSCVSAGCGSSQASTSCLWNLATWSRGRSNRKWCQEAAPWRCCAKGRPTPQQKGRSEGQTRFQALFLDFFFIFHEPWVHKNLEASALVPADPHSPELGLQLGQQTLYWVDQLWLKTTEAKRVINAPNFHLFLLFETRGAFVGKPAISWSDIAYSTSCSSDT